jgi:aspartyl-tRNA(Asn)/glutamyl-tRNA(Gln) amidotransferase subunit B
MDKKYEAVVGLEVHAQLLTKSKIFCGCSTEFGRAPNTNVCPVCLGHPGVLPVLNKKAIEYIIKMGLACKCTVNSTSIFARKNYFYPDLPKGYQISQFELPVCENGTITINTNGVSKKIRIKRIHIEEDAGKSIHDQGSETLVDLNRAGVPLMEIVTEPDLNSAEEAALFLSQIKQIVQYLEICSGNMEEGSLRCDANISIRLKGEEKLGIKTEVKNMNSFKNVEKAINYEINRQIDLVEEGENIIQQTLLWNADLEAAFPMRSKEESHDYRYFPEPDLFPVNISEKWKDDTAHSLPELPKEKLERFVSDYNLSSYDAEVLTQQKPVAEFFEAAASNAEGDYKSVSNWVMGDVMKTLNEKKISIDEFPVAPKNIAKLIKLINSGLISSKIAKEVFTLLFDDNRDPEVIVREKNLIQISDSSELEKVIESILQNNQAQVEEYLNGKEKVFVFFIGQIMKQTKGKANPQLVTSLLNEKLKQRK